MTASSIDSLGNDHATHAGVERGETRTRVVVAVTAAMMVLEITVGTLTGSLALTADGWHMATHAGALGLAALAYTFARKNAANERFTFGTGKTYALAGYTSAVLLLCVALWMGGESLRRLRHPVPIQFADALPVAIVGLVVNLACAVLLHSGHDHASAPIDELTAAGESEHPHDHLHSHDHNLRSAYVHVVADAFTSVLAISALVAGRAWGWRRLDPMMGIVGAAVISRWALDLIRGSARQLLDAAIEPRRRARVRAALEARAGVRVLDLHLWEIGPGRRACVASVSDPEPRDAQSYRDSIRAVEPVSHLTVEVHREGE
jgi:cation diffusion facilitator family transporter